MFNINTLLSSFESLVGVRPANDTRSSVLSSAVKRSDSGLYINAAHPLLTVDNFEATAADIHGLTSLRDYDSQATYQKGVIVQNIEQWFESLANNNTADLTDATKWVETSVVDQFLKSTYKDAVTRVFRRVELDKQVSNKGRRLVSSTPLFFVEGKEVNQRSDSFVGLRLWVQNNDLAGVLNKVGLQLKQAQSITLYLFHTSSQQPVQAWEVEYTNSGRFQWFSANEPLDFSDINGYYTIGYFESDLEAGNTSIRRRLKLNESPMCEHCNRRDYDYYTKWSPYLSLEAIRVPNDFLSVSAQTWSEEDIEIMPLQNYGLNLNLSVNCDLTNIVLENKGIFANAIFEQWKIILLESIAFTARTNRLGNTIAQAAHFALHDPQNRDNPYNSLEKAFGAIEVDFSGLNPLCLPCEDLQNGVEIDTVWG